MRKIKIIVADDHAVVRMGLIALLESEKDISVVGEAGDGDEAVKTACATAPDVVLMDLVMPRTSGIDATATLKERLPRTKVLILTTFSDAADIAKALTAGADGALLKSSDYADVIGAIRRVADGQRVVSPEIRKMLAEQPVRPGLTDRQFDILASMSRGLTNSDIAKQFGITPDGVKFHITSILAKLGAANRSEAVAIALRNKLLRG